MLRLTYNAVHWKVGLQNCFGFLQINSHISYAPEEVRECGVIVTKAQLRSSDYNQDAIQVNGVQLAYPPNK